MLKSQFLTKYSKEEISQSAQQNKLLDYGGVLLREDFKYIYRPGDDSYLLIDTLIRHLDEIIQQNPQIVIEIGYIITNKFRLRVCS